MKSRPHFKHAIPNRTLIVLQAQLYQQTQKSRPIASLMPWLLDRRNLEAAWQRCRQADGADTPGPDGVICRDLQSSIRDWLGDLADALYHRRYRPIPPRWIEIAKPNKPNETRRLGILSVRDRVVAAACKQVLEPILDSIFTPASFGFRPGRSVQGALHEVLRDLRQAATTTTPLQVGVSMDVASCFDGIDHASLLNELRNHVADADALALIQQLLDVGATVVSHWWMWGRRACGLIQGSALSPLLCNLALHPVDLAVQEQARTLAGRLAYFRYADNLLLLAHDSRIANQGISLIQRQLGRLHLKLGNARPLPTPLEPGIDWLGVRLRPRHCSWLEQADFGYEVPGHRVHVMLDRLNEMTEPPSERLDPSTFDMSRWIVSLNDQLREWTQAYRFADNSSEVFAALDEHARERFAQLLTSITGQKRQQISRRHYLRLPRGFWTWQVDAVRLVTLAAQAPRRPIGLTRRPQWMRAQPNGPALPEAAAGDVASEILPIAE